MNAKIEFSCGDGLFISEILENDELLEVYDGKVDVNCIKIENPRNPGKPIIHTGQFKISFDYDRRADERGKESITKMRVSRKW